MKCVRPRVGVLAGRVALEQSGNTWRAAGASPSDRGYDHEWRKARAEWLREHRLCTHCEDEGIFTDCSSGGGVVDHRIPHRGDKALFWDRGNWQTLCKTHHDRKTAAELKSGAYPLLPQG